jgi:hypothetical protein
LLEDVTQPGDVSRNIIKTADVRAADRTGCGLLPMKRARDAQKMSEKFLIAFI